VNFTILSGPARLSGNTMQFTGIGSVTVQAFQDGSANYLPAVPITQSFTVTLGRPTLRSASNGASYTAVLAPGGFASLFGESLYQVNSSGNPADLSIFIRDAVGATHRAEVAYAGFGQVNLLVPREAAPGPAELTLTNFAGSSNPLTVSIARIAPGLFSADGSGRGAPAGLATIVRPDLTRTEQALAECRAQTCPPVPIPAGLGVQTFLSLYATGMREAASASVEIGGIRSQVQYAGPQGQFPGLDQINVVVPPELAGRGLVSIRLSVDGVFAPELTISIR
jgi:uncharacterized protein (TIGR03437 family)